MDRRRPLAVWFQRAGLAGALLAAVGLAWDAVIHARDPSLVQHEATFTLSSPAHLALAIGLLTTLAGQVLAAAVRLRHPGLRQIMVAGAGLLVAGMALAGLVAVRQERDVLAAQRAAADRLVADTARGIDRYRDPAQAIADGYQPVTPLNWPIVEWVNPSYVRAGRLLDPRHPERLMYVSGGRGSRLAGAMFVMPRAFMAAPTIAGSALHWHGHADLCFLPNGTIVGTNGYGFPCPTGSTAAPTPAMLHVWIVPNPAGPFADDLSPGAIQAVVNA
jgi:hypothetical protein